MRVTGSGRQTSIGQNAKARSKQGDAAFTVSGNGSSTRAAAPASLGSIQNIDALLSVQGVDDPTTGRRRAVDRGFAIIDVLEDIKIGLLAGRISQGRIERLSTILKERRPSGDARIDNLIAEIEVRAHVELAKLDRYAA